MFIIKLTELKEPDYQIQLHALQRELFICSEMSSCNRFKHDVTWKYSLAASRKQMDAIAEYINNNYPLIKYNISEICSQ